jgi:hypothetical protein
VIDDANRKDPRTVFFKGESHPQELLYSQRMLAWTQHLKPGATEELLLAVRAQHIERWQIPRGQYPMDRRGYLRWREELKKRHAARLADIMRQSGYAETSVSRAADLILRKQMTPDLDGQVLEDAACLVFLQYEFADFAAKTSEAKVIDILRKSWKKMSAQAHAEALKLGYGVKELALVQKALADTPSG